jgi:hypothetical protein
MAGASPAMTLGDHALQNICRPAIDTGDFKYDMRSISLS